MKNLICIILIFLLASSIISQSVKEYVFCADSVHVFSTPNPVNTFYLPYDISGITKPMYAEPFASNVSFPVLAQDIYGPAGNYGQTFFGGDFPNVIAFGYTSSTVIINENFSANDFPLILEGDFFNRNSNGNYNESYFWLGNSNYTHFNPSNSILPSANVQQGIIIGGLPDRSIISNGRSFLLPSIALLNETHNFANYNNWYTLKVLLDVNEDGRLVIYNIFIDDNCVLLDPIIVEASDDLNLNSFKLAICVDDYAKEFKVTSNADLFVLPDIVVCENDFVSFFSDFADILCLNFNYEWNLPGSNISTSNKKFPSNITYNNSGFFESSLKVTNGEFNKIIPFNVKVESSQSQFITQSLCFNDSIYFNNQWISTSGLYQEVLTAQYGCDSTITLELIFWDSIKTTTNIPLCQGDSIQINGQWIYDEGDFKTYTQAINGCDSVSMIFVDLIPITLVLDTVNLCEGDSIFLNNQWYFGAQDISYLDYNSLCPVQIYSTLVIKPYYDLFDKVIFCANDSIYFNNQWISTSGLYQEVLTAQNGCDSTITLELIFWDSIKTTTNIPLCQGDSIQINGQWVYDEGDFTTYTQSINGCDSLSSIFVDLIPNVFVLDTISLCEGDSIFLNNQWYYDAHNVVYFDFNSFCPIKISATVVGKPSYLFLDVINICPNDSIFFQDSWIREAGSFSFNYQTQDGCDSLYNLETILIALPAEPIAKPDCDNGEYDLTVAFDPSWYYQWSNGAEVSPTTFSSGAVASISYVHGDEGCLVSYTIDLPSIPNDGDVPFFSDTIVYPEKTLKYTIAMDSNLWSLDWVQDNNLQCEDCFVNILQTTVNSDIDLIFYHVSGCKYYRDFSIGIDNNQDLYIPNVFAPKSTSGNDKWWVIIPECFAVQLVKIYDRWGNLVYTSENPQSVEWDGIYKGNYLEQGVYTYLIQYTDPALNQKIISGDITLLR